VGEGEEGSERGRRARRWRPVHRGHAREGEGDAVGLRGGCPGAGADRLAREGRQLAGRKRRGASGKGGGQGPAVSGVSSGGRGEWGQGGVRKGKGVVRSHTECEGSEGASVHHEGVVGSLWSVLALHVAVLHYCQWLCCTALALLV